MTQRFTLDDSSVDPRRRPSPKGPKRKSGRTRITKRLVALSSAAILSVYAAGYVATQSAEQQIAAQAAPAAVVIRTVATQSAPLTAALAPSATQAPATAAPEAAAPPTAASAAPAASAPAVTQAAAAPAVPAASAPASSHAATAAAPAPSPTKTVQAGAYRDGTYVGAGFNRHANIRATVVVQNGRIVSAQATQCETRYPCSLIDGLPSQVVSRQKAQVNLVSGATDSSRAYLQAVTQALAQAL